MVIPLEVMEPAYFKKNFNLEGSRKRTDEDFIENGSPLRVERILVLLDIVRMEDV